MIAFTVTTDGGIMQRSGGQESELAFESVLDVFARLLQIGLGLIAFAFGFQLLVVSQFAPGLFPFAFGFFCSILDFV